MNPTNELEQMARTIRRLEARLQTLEQLTSGNVDSVVLRCGESMIVMKKNGAIAIAGRDIVIQSSGDVKVKAGKNVDIKGAKVTGN